MLTEEVKIDCCAHCGNAYERFTPSQRYCSDRCHYASNKMLYTPVKREAQPCVTCGAMCKPPGKRGPVAKYCSPECRPKPSRDKVRAWNEAREWFDCRNCGKRFRASKWRPACTPACAEQLKRVSAALKKARSRKPHNIDPRPCDWCGDTYKPKKGNQRWCSKLCAKKAKHAATAKGLHSDTVKAEIEELNRLRKQWE